MIQIFDSMTELLESVPKENMTFEMCNAFVKAWGKIHGYGGGKSEVHPFTMYPKIMVSVSGGADSDIVLDLVERLWMFLELSKSPMVAINPFPLVKDISPIKRILIVGFRFFPSFFSRGWNSGLQYMWNDVEGHETLAIP